MSKNTTGLFGFGFSGSDMITNTLFIALKHKSHLSTNKEYLYRLENIP